MATADTPDSRADVAEEHRPDGLLFLETLLYGAMNGSYVALRFVNHFKVNVAEWSSTSSRTNDDIGW